MRAREGLRTFEHHAHERALVVGLVESAAREDLPEDDASGVDVREAIDVVVVELLGRHVRDLAFELPCACRVEAPGRLGDAEVEQSRVAVHADHDVLG